MIEWNTGLYIRRRESGNLWELFLGGYTKTLPSLLYQSYLDYFKSLHKDYEWVILERRRDTVKHINVMYKFGTEIRVNVMVDGEELVPAPERFVKKEVECLSLWHMDEIKKTFMGSISNRICSGCRRKEYNYLQERDRHDNEID